MAEQGTRLIGGSLLVAAAKTAQPLLTPQEFIEKLKTLEAGLTAAKSVIIQALSTNGSAVVVSGPDAVAEIGAKGATTKRVGIALEKNESIGIDIDDPSKIWVDAITTKEGVNWMVLLA